jgi:MFS family permease
MPLEYPVPDEIVFLYARLALNALFCVVMTAAAYRALVRAPSPAGRPAPKDERLFSLAQVMGTVSGLTGVILTLALIGRRWPSERFWIFLPFYALFFLPYALALLSWLAAKRRERPAEWHIEKQMRDIRKASFTTLLLSIPGLAVLALFRGPLHFYWFPYYLFLIQLVFSASTLYYFKRE